MKGEDVLLEGLFDGYVEDGLPLFSKHSKYGCYVRDA